MLKCSVRVGTVWVNNESGGIVTIVATSLEGHQYDRSYVCDCLSSDSRITRIDDYQLLTDYSCLTREGSHHDSTAI